MSEAITVIEDDERRCNCGQMKATLDIILKELRELKMSLRGNEPQITALLSAIYEIFAGAPFTAAWLLEESLDNPALSRHITNLMPDPTVKRLSGFLKRSTGGYGNYILSVTNKHSREGAMFRVTIK